jgi:nitrite reductase/ring-hydroxylating ferredoxin subunit
LLKHDAADTRRRSWRGQQDSDFVYAGDLDELKARGRLAVRGRHRPVLLVHEGGRVFAFDNRCPHMGFPLDSGSIEDGILTCQWHHARFESASGCTFDLWADDVPTCPVETRAGAEIWVKPVFGYADLGGHWQQRLADGLSHTSASSSPKRCTVSWLPASRHRRW